VIGLAADDATMVAGLIDLIVPRPRDAAAPSTMLFHCWHSPHWPTHFVLAQPHSPQVYSFFARAAIDPPKSLVQNYQARPTPSARLN
jgi:hypothetical protein